MSGRLTDCPPVPKPSGSPAACVHTAGDHNRAKTPSMPITQFLGNSKFDPETRRIMGVAFEMARVALNVADRGDLANEVIAKRIIELAKAGELNQV
jgi:hypothetical protein